MESHAFGRARSAADNFGFIHTIVHTGTFPFDAQAESGFSACSAELEIGAVYPHPVHDDSHFTC